MCWNIHGVINKQSGHYAMNERASWHPEGSVGSDSALRHPSSVSGTHASSGASLRSDPWAQGHVAHGVQPVQDSRRRTLVPHALVIIIKLRRMLNSDGLLHLPS